MTAKAVETLSEESWVDRAVQTRLDRRLDRYGPSFYAEFCLGAPVQLVEVVNHVVVGLEKNRSSTKIVSARDLVYLTLRTDYPCETDPADTNSQFIS